MIDDDKALVVVVDSKPLKAFDRPALVPQLVADAGEKAARRFLEYFAATIHNENTRAAYYHAC
jgi:hypothetical protein